MTKEFIIGVDEAGRGPLAGPVVAGAVVLNPDKIIHGLKDSKKLSEKQREALFEIITRDATAYALGEASALEIDQHNILQATMMAMQRAVEKLVAQLPAQSVVKILVDGNRCPVWSYPSQAIIGGDASVPAISAASIMAKVTRDRLMKHYDEIYPGYGFAVHKAYPTKAHLAALTRLGPCALHRLSFAPVKILLAF